MSRRLVRRIGFASGAWPRTALLFSLVLTGLAIWATATNLRPEMDMKKLLPEDSQVARDLKRAEHDFGGTDFMLCSVEILPGAPRVVQEDPAAFLLSIRPEIEQALDDQRFFRTKGFNLSVPGSTFREDAARQIALLTEADFEVLEGKLEPETLDRTLRDLSARIADAATTEALARIRRDPIGFGGILSNRAKIVAGPLRTVGGDDALVSSDNQMMLLVLWPVGSPTDMLFSRALFQFVSETRDGLFKRQPGWRTSVKIDFMGPHIQNAGGAQTIERDMVVTSAISIAAVVLLFCIGFRQPESLLFIVFPLATGLAWTLGTASLLVERVTQFTLTFAAILIGLGTDFTIHLYNRYLEDARSGRTVEEALQKALDFTSPGIVAGALTTGFSFVGLALTDFVGFRELGIVGGIGILMGLLSMAVTMPALMVLFARRAGDNKQALATLGLKKVTFVVESYPRMTVAAGMCIAAYLGIFGTRMEFREDFSELSQSSEAQVRLADSIGKHFALPSDPVLVIVEAPTFDKALEANDRLYRNILSAARTYPLLSIDSLRAICPSPGTQANSLRRFAALPFDRLKERLASAAPGFPAGYFEPFEQRLAEFREAAAMALGTAEPLIGVQNAADFAFVDVLQRYIIHDQARDVYRVMTRAYPPQGDWSKSIPAPFLESLGAGLDPAPTVIGSPILAGELQGIIIRDLARVVLVVVLAIYLYLVFYFRCVRRAALALVPVAFSIMGVLGAMQLAGIRLNYLNILAITILVGVGVDNAIHLLGRYYESNARNMKLTVERTGRAVAVTSLTTIFGFGALSFASFPAIREIGYISIAGVALNLFAALVFLPALLSMLEGKFGYSGGPGDELG